MGYGETLLMHQNIINEKQNGNGKLVREEKEAAYIFNDFFVNIV